MISPSRPGISGSLALWVATGLVAGLYVTLRVACATGLPLFNDEAIYLSWVQRMFTGAMTPSLWMEKTGKLPLFELWLLPFVRVIPDPMVAGRVGALTASLFGGWLAWCLGRRVSGDPWGGCLALLLMAVNPYFVIHDSLALYESLSTPLELGWLYYLLRASEPGLTGRQRYGRAVVAGLFWAAGMFNKEYFKLLLPALAGLVLIERWRAAARPPGLVDPRAAVVAASLAVAGALILRTLPGAAGITVDIAALLHPWREVMAHPLRILEQQLRGFGPAALYLPLPALLLIPAALANADPPVRTAARSLTLFWTLLVIPSFIFIQVPFARYLHLNYPLPILIAVCGWPAIRRALVEPSRSLASALTSAAVALLLLAELATGVLTVTDPARLWRMHPLDRDQYVTGWAAGWGLRDLAEFLDRERIREPVGFIGGEAIVSAGLSLVAAPRQRLPDLRPLFHDGRGVPAARDLMDVRYFLFNHRWPAAIPPGWQALFAVEKPGGVSRMILYRIRDLPGVRRPMPF